MMQHSRIKGRKLIYRPVTETEMQEADRQRAYEGYEIARNAFGAKNRLLAAARSDRPGFDTLSRWIVATCRVGNESAIHDELAEKGIETWCPMEKMRARPRRSLKAVDIYRPYFKGYLFARVIPDNEAYVGLLSTSCVRGLLGQDGKPFIMPEKLMNSLMLRSRKDEKDHDDERALPVRKGQQVVIRSGPLSDFQATVRRVIGTRWKLLAEVDIFGRMTAVELDIDSVADCS